MPVPFQRPRALVLLLALTAAAFLVAAGLASSAMAANGAVYTQTNDPAGNVVQRFGLSHDGALEPAGTFPTGGVGLANLGGRQGAVELSGNGRRLFAVNAGSNTVSVFKAGPGRLELIDQIPSGGTAPVSIAAARGRVYVLNSGGVANVAAFDREDGTLEPLGAQDLAPGASGAAQVSVMPDGKSLVVTERLSNRLETLPLDAAGRPGAPVVTASNGLVPFGFAISNSGTIVVSEAGSGAASSYRAGTAGALESISASTSVGLGGVCWVAITPSGRFAYTGNASGSISAFAIAPDGTLTSLHADGIAAPLVPSPRDLDFDASGRFLIAVSPGNAATGGQVTSYRVATDGSLRLVDAAPALTGLTGAAAS
jgi:6-phosphogluconolactonase (cycloisomerase 2 family)